MFLAEVLEVQVHEKKSKESEDGVVNENTGMSPHSVPNFGKNIRPLSGFIHC